GTMRDEGDYAVGRINNPDAKGLEFDRNEIVLVREGKEDKPGHVLIGEVKIGEDGIRTVTFKNDSGSKETVSLAELIGRGYDRVMISQSDIDRNKGLITEESPSRSKQIIKDKLGVNAKMNVVIDKMLNKVASGYMSPAELEKVLIVLAARFEKIEDMEKYLGLGSKYSKEEVSAALVKKIGEVLSFEQRKEFNEEERNQEISILRGAAEVLMAAAENREVKNKFNEIRDVKGISDLQGMITGGMKVNMYIVANAMAEGITIKDNNIVIDDFVINIDELKTALETKEPKFNMFKKDKEELLQMLSGSRGQDSFVTPMDIRNARAVARAA
ncbi:MAG: hypothetical protein FWD54_07625, partial [Endomicrobia bacterium]|nr:hypothetical protein [Endomicrobiia bacterium]